MKRSFHRNLGKTSGILILAAASAISGCSNNLKPKGANNSPVVANVDVSKVSSAPTSGPDSECGIRVNASITINKSALFDASGNPRKFLYGADLQHSSYHEASLNLFTQSMALGHLPAVFRISGNQLQLLSDETRHYPGSNHPSLPISRFKILKETDTQLTVSQMDSSVFLGEIYEGTRSTNPNVSGLTDPTVPNPKDHWTCSFDYDSNGDYLLQQTGIISTEGDVVEFMESIFPAENLTAGKNFQKIVMDPNDPRGVGGTDGIVARFRFLQGEAIYDPSAADPQSQVSYAQHIDLTPKADGSMTTIDWYITRNVPDSALEAIKLGVEGWNRYFSTFKGFKGNPVYNNGNVMRFMGKLPAGIHLGDPRYNVINWDSITIAGAAYESQASDPFTGKQSHSLIYMPAAWVVIGSDYWKQGGASNPADAGPSAPAAAAPVAAAPKSPSAPAKFRLDCAMDVSDGNATAASGRLSADEVKNFGTEVLKAVLFHEVGHSLGLAHNFKGSLTFDRSKPDSAFSSSIMDYSDYELMVKAYSSLHDVNGPILAYDRQIMDTIYNNGVDIAAEPVLPACNDAEADTQAGAVDPLCNRYDTEIDPTLSVVTAFNRINLETMPNDVTLSQAIAKMPDFSLTSDQIAKAADADAVAALSEKLVGGITDAMYWYIIYGKASVLKTVKLNTKSLFEFERKILPDTYKEADMRARAFKGVQDALAMKALPAPVVAAVKAAIDAGFAKIAQAPGAAKVKSMDDLKASALKEAMDWANDPDSGLPALRTGMIVYGTPFTGILSALARDPLVPYFYGKLSGEETDYEAAIVQLLESVVEDSVTRNPIERMTAAASLITYKDRMPAEDAAILAAKAKIQAELANAMDNKSRETAEKILSALKPPVAVASSGN